MKYEKPQLFEIEIAQFAQGALGDPPMNEGEGSGGLPPTPPGDNPFNG